MDCATLNLSMFRVCFLCPSLKYLVLKYLQVGVCTNPPEWFKLCLKDLNPREPKKRVDSSLLGAGMNTNQRSIGLNRSSRKH